MCFFCRDPASSGIYTLSLHDALPICERDPALGGAFPRPASARAARRAPHRGAGARGAVLDLAGGAAWQPLPRPLRSEEHTSELQSQSNLVCRLLHEKKKYELNDIFDT